MKVLTVQFATSGGALGSVNAQAYSYLYDGRSLVEVGDFAVANNALVVVKKVCEEEEYLSSSGALNLSTLKKIEHVLSRKEEREEAKKQERIKEIKARLHSLRQKVEDRRVFEDAASEVGAEGKKLLTELESLEGKI